MSWSAWPELLPELERVAASQSLLSDARGLLQSISPEIAGALERMGQSPSTCREVSGHSYRHPNGFNKIVLASTATGVKLRLHVWQLLGDELQVDPHIHNHRWNFASRVLVGELRWEEFSVAKEHGDEYFSYEYEPTGSGFSLKALGKQLLCMERQGCTQAGEVYVVDHMVPHRVTIASNRIAATLVLQSSPLTSRNRVFSREPIRSDGDERLKTTARISPDHIKSILEKTLSHLGSSPTQV